MEMGSELFCLRLRKMILKNRGRDKLKILTFGVKNDQILALKKVDGS
jgi:hypothetical protein